MGEWLTRRILRSFSGLEDELPASSGEALDSWGLPVPAASRRDSEEMLARVGKSESESNEAWRRIEEQLKGLSRRLDSSERSHSENNRVMSRTAQEMNIAAREQAQAFEQFGQNIMGLNQRLERLERGAAHDGVRDAIKALHQGLSRLADQISATANNSAGQLEQVTANLEKLATQVSQAWEEAEAADQLLNRRIDVTELELGRRMDTAEHALEARLSAAEKTAQFNTNALDHALEKIEAATVQRAADQADAQRRAAQQDENLHRLEESLTGLQSRLPPGDLKADLKAELEKHLEDIRQDVEQSVTVLTRRLEQDEAQEKFDAAMQALSFRLEKLEKDQAALEAEVVSRLSAPEPAPASQPAPSEAPAEAPPFSEPPYAAHEPEPPPHQEAIDAFTPPGTPHSFSFDGSEQEQQPDALPPKLESEAGPGHEPAVESAFEPGFEPGFESEFEDVFQERRPEQENFLAQARRSARAASEKAESERLGRLSAFRWSQDSAESEEKSRPRFLIPLIVALLVVLAAAAALILSQRAKMPAPVPQPTSTLSKGPTFSVPPPPRSDDSQSTPQADGPAGNSADMPANGPSNDAADGARDFSSQRSEPAASDGTSHAATPAPKEAVAAPEKSAPTSAEKPAAKPAEKPMGNPAPKPASAAKNAAPAPIGADRVTQAANAGNPTALAILGLKALDSGGYLADAVKYLSQAAEKGQPVAQYRLGTLYERGQGVTADAAKAMHWYELSANQGNRKAMHNLAVAYTAGAAGKKNMTEAARWFAKAAALGLSDSQFNLAVLYERGDGVPQSLVDAYKWYSVAASSGDAESKARIGVLQTQLSDADKATANRSAASFHAAPLNRAANVPPEAADLSN
ncbi:MAG TPA: hypothetical protein VFI23_15975 [Rhizomicrobium sp.]|nr:hypothetical protein [Rhizomicrobium sp.]